MVTEENDDDFSPCTEVPLVAHSVGLEPLVATLASYASSVPSQPGAHDFLSRICFMPFSLRVTYSGSAAWAGTERAREAKAATEAAARSRRMAGG